MTPGGAAKQLCRRLVWLQERLRANLTSAKAAPHMCAEAEALKVAILALGGTLPSAADPVRARERGSVERLRTRCTCTTCPIHAKPEAAE